MELPTEQQLEFKEDGTTNTLSTVQKDNLVYNQHRKNEWREFENVSSTLKQTMGTGGNNVPMAANCLDANQHKGVTPEMYYEKSKRNIVGKGKLRRLTPKECFRLQGFLNDEVNLEGLSDTQRYKLAGNGQSVNVVEKIFREMFKAGRDI